MDISYDEARAANVRYYAEIGNGEEHAETIVSKDPKEVFDVYRIIQEDIEKSKHIKVVDYPVAGLHTKKTVWIDDPPAGSK